MVGQVTADYVDALIAEPLIVGPGTHQAPHPLGAVQ